MDISLHLFKLIIQYFIFLSWISTCWLFNYWNSMGNTSWFSLYSFILVRLLNKQFLAYVNHARIRSWNQPVPIKSKVSCSRKRGHLMGFELTTDRYPPITSQKRYPLRHAASYLVIRNITVVVAINFIKLNY